MWCCKLFTFKLPSNFSNIITTPYLSNRLCLKIDEKAEKVYISAKKIDMVLVI